jgi:signal transduction histidine kinase
LFNRLGLRSEIVLQLSLLMAASIIFVSLLIMKVSEQELLQQRIQHNTSLLKVLAANLDLKTRSPQEIASQLQHVLQQVDPNLGMTAIAVLDSNQIRYQATAGDVTNWPDKKEGALALLSRGMSTKLHYRGFLPDFLDPGGNYLLVTLPLNRNYNKAKVIQAYFSLDDIRALAYRARGYLLPYILLVGLTLTLFGSYLLEKIIVRPIKALQQASKEIALGHLQQSVVAGGPKEIYHLTDHFNRMSQALHHSRKETETHIQSLQQINHQLEQTRDELLQSEKMASIGHLSAGIAHEIGNPLGALLGYLNLLGGQIDATAADLSRDILRRSLHEAKRIDLLLRDLLDYARPDQETCPSCEPVSTIKEAAQLLDRQNQVDRNRLSLQLPEQLPCVALTPRKLQQVLINLLLNARDASPAEERIDLSAALQGDQVRVTITDRGAGIPPAERPHLFDPFFTTKPQGQGRGLGLFIAHRIVSDAGGKIEIESAPEQGTHFTLLLPVMKAGADEA